MTEFLVNCRYDKKKHQKLIKAKNDIGFYKKNCPRTLYVLDRFPGVHPEILDQIERDIQFMDRSGLVKSGHKSPIRGLMHKHDAWHNRYSFQDDELKKGNWIFNPYSSSGGEDICNFDHTTAWRKPGERWPVLVVTEPYGMMDSEIESCKKVAELTGYRYKIYEPSSKSLWNDNCFMIFWWHKDFYKPDFNILVLNKDK